jgi:hypothetical protein
VLSLFSSRRNWISPQPLIRKRVCPPLPPPFGSGGRGTLADERGGGRVSISTREHTLWYSLYMYFVLRPTHKIRPTGPLGADIFSEYLEHSARMPATVWMQDLHLYHEMVGPTSSLRLATDLSPIKKSLDSNSERDPSSTVQTITLAIAVDFIKEMRHKVPLYLSMALFFQTLAGGLN